MKVKGIAIREKSHGPMIELDAVTVTRQCGLTGDSRGKPNNRQVTLLSESQWQTACQELGHDLPWTYRRANILVSDVVFSENMIGKEVHIGTLTLRVTGETDPCPRMDKQYQGLTKALEPDWRGGVCCRVIADGDIVLSQEVTIK